MSLKKGKNIVFTKLAVSQKTFWAKSLVGQEAAGKAGGLIRKLKVPRRMAFSQNPIFPLLPTIIFSLFDLENQTKALLTIFTWRSGFKCDL